MKRSFRTRIVLAVCVTIGLMVAPISAPLMAQSTGMQMSLSDNTRDMPCCPDAVDHKMPQDSGCKDCLLMAVCALKTAQMTLYVAFVNFDPVLMVRISVPDDATADGLIGTPPARPPRGLV